MLSNSVMSDSLWPHGLQPTRLLCPWDFPGKNTVVALPFLPPGDLPHPGIEPGPPSEFFTTVPPGKPNSIIDQAFIPRLDCLTCTLPCIPCHNSREKTLSPSPYYRWGNWIVESNLVKSPRWAEKPRVKPSPAGLSPPLYTTSSWMVSTVFTNSYFPELGGSKVHWGSQYRRCGNHCVVTVCTVWGSAQNDPRIHTCQGQLSLLALDNTSVNLKAVLSIRPWLRRQAGQGLSSWPLWRQKCSFTV